ncbi:MAG: hypothetical protein WDW38_006863 [Sanguina aurantia]
MHIPSVDLLCQYSDTQHLSCLGCAGAADALLKKASATTAASAVTKATAQKPSQPATAAAKRTAAEASTSDSDTPLILQTFPATGAIPQPPATTQPQPPLKPTRPKSAGAGRTTTKDKASNAVGAVAKKSKQSATETLPTKAKKATGLATSAKSTQVQHYDSYEFNAVTFSVGDDIFTVNNLDPATWPHEEHVDFCVVCASPEGIASMVECDGCMGAYHMRCLTPKLKAVPEVGPGRRGMHLRQEKVAVGECDVWDL